MPVLVLIADGDVSPAVVEAGLGTGHAAHPRALLYLLTFELGEHSEEANHGLAEWGRCVEALLHGDEVHALWTEDFFDEVERVPLGAGETVQLVDQHEVELVRLGDELLDAGTVQVAAGVPAIHIDVRDNPVFGLAVRNQAFFLLADGVALLRLFQRGNTDVEGCAVHQSLPPSSSTAKLSNFRRLRPLRFS